MSDLSLERTEFPTPPGGGNTGADDPGQLRLSDGTTTIDEPVAPPITKPTVPIPPPRRDRAGTVEHLAARRAVPALNTDTPEVNQRLATLRADLTAAVTGFRWEGVSVQDTVNALIPLLDIGPFQQWWPVLVPFIFEIDRAGNLIPVWLKIIEREDPHDLPPDANPAETTIGRARRIGLLMLGNYKSPELSQALGKFATDPNSSLYATQSLVKQSTTAALQALISALKDAEGWAKVDIVEVCLSLNQSRFYDLLLASGLDRASGLESYIAVPLYRSIPLEGYLRGSNTITPRLSQQAALVFGQVLQDSMNTAPAGTVPIVFERNLPALAIALFDGARSAPGWQKVIAVHRLALLVGRYWADMARGAVQDPGIVQPIQACLAMMPDIERWMNGPGRDILLATLTGEDEEALTPVVKVLGELREPRAISLLSARLDATISLANREQAIQLGQICDTLGRLGDRRAVQPLLLLVNRTLNVGARTAHPKRRDNLVAGDADIPGSIVYAAVVRAFGQLGDRSTLDFILRAANDFDPYIRTQALEALKRVDPTGEDMRTRLVVREALNDPRDTVIRVACQLVVQYRDNEAVSSLQRLTQTRPEVSQAAYDALRQFGQLVQ